MTENKFLKQEKVHWEQERLCQTNWQNLYLFGKTETRFLRPDVKRNDLFIKKCGAEVEAQ